MLKKLITIGSSLVLLASSHFAVASLVPFAKSAAKQGVIGKVLGDMTFTASGEDVFTLPYVNSEMIYSHVILFVGETCANLVESTSVDMPLTLNTPVPFPAAAIPGNQDVCFKLDFASTNLRATTGPIRAFWDAEKNEFSHMEPQHAQVNFG